MYDCGLLELDGLEMLGFRCFGILEFGIGHAGLLYIWFENWDLCFWGLQFRRFAFGIVDLLLISDCAFTNGDSSFQCMQLDLEFGVLQLLCGSSASCWILLK